MKLYRVIGKGKDSGRARSRTYWAKDEKAAASAARKDGTNPESISIEPLWVIAPTVAGFSHLNSDKSSRQQIIQSTPLRTELTLTHESDNRHDKHAIRITRPDGKQLGYIPQDRAKLVWQWFQGDPAGKYSAILLAVENVGQRQPLYEPQILAFFSPSTADEADIKSAVISELARYSLNSETMLASLTPRRAWGSISRPQSRPVVSNQIGPVEKSGHAGEIPTIISKGSIIRQSAGKKQSTGCLVFVTAVTAACAIAIGKILG